jgi:hypothetical protein
MERRGGLLVRLSAVSAKLLEFVGEENELIFQIGRPKLLTLFPVAITLVCKLHRIV